MIGDISLDSCNRFRIRDALCLVFILSTRENQGGFYKTWGEAVVYLLHERAGKSRMDQCFWSEEIIEG